MRLFRLSPFLLALAVACHGGTPAGKIACTRDRDCPAGQGCGLDGLCADLPCGGCQPEQACGSDGKCVTAQGATCSDHTCPTGYPCNGAVCAKACGVSDSDCDTGFHCSNHSCIECLSNNDCATKPGKTACSAAGTCVQCASNFDCTQALGSNHYCDANTCKPGCKTTNDCNQSAGETCDISTTPGKCVQCHTSADCASQGPTAQACDDTNHCVQCYGLTISDANHFCGGGTPECNLTTKTCVECLPSNNQTGLDCGYPVSAGAKDPHDAMTCNPSTKGCVAGCQFDEQCGCPYTAPGSTESGCSRRPDQEHCDPARTTMVGVSGPTLGACVQCTTNTHCAYKVTGSAQYSGIYATLNGARCVSDQCVEGCDATADCPSGELCHIGSSSSDPNNHKCVQCACDVLSADGSYCEVTSTGAAACNNTPSGKPQVCDKTTLTCRLKRQNESCTTDSECGANNPQSTCFGLGAAGGVSNIGFCAIKKVPNIGNATYCTADHQPPGKCAEYCDDACACQAGSACNNSADTSSAPAKVCVPNSCNFP